MARKILYKYYATFLAQKYFIEDKFRYNRNALNGSLSSKGKEKKEKDGHVELNLGILSTEWRYEFKRTTNAQLILSSMSLHQESDTGMGVSLNF